MPMYRFINLLLLSRISIPFLKIYFAYHQLKKGNGYLHDFWKDVQLQIPALTELDRPLQKRIFHYLFANSLTTQWFANLLKHNPSRKEKETGYFIAMATPVADYLVDQEKLTAQDIYRIIDKKSSHPWQQLSCQLLENYIKHHPSREVAQQLIYKTLQAQEESLKQRENSIHPDKLKEITWAKGGYALLLYRSALNHPISDTEWNAVFQLGGLMQLHNDIFDLYRDLQEGIATLPSETKSIDDLSYLYQLEIEKTFHLFEQLSFNRYRKQKFYLLLQLAVQTGHICLQQYRDLEIKYGVFTPVEYSRKELVCDMEDLVKIGKTIFATINKKY